MSKILTPNAEEFDSLIKGQKTVIADFFANWCGPCKMIAPLLEKLSEKYSDKIIFVKIDVDAYPELADAYKIYNIPNVKAIKGGTVIGERIGYVGEGELEAFILGSI